MPEKPADLNTPAPMEHGPPRTYEFEPDPGENECLVFTRVAKCPVEGVPKRFLVAVVLGPHGVNPGLLINRPLGVAAVAEICRLVQERKHLQPA